jgi:hypothetical protein
MNLTIDTSPLLPGPIFWIGVVMAVGLISFLFYRRSRGAALRALALGALLLALLNPTLRQEERESLANIALVMIDESTSQTLADRPTQTAAIKRDLEAKLAAIPNLEVKVVEAAKPSGEGTGTQIFADLNRALANTPTDRLAGVIVVTDGQVHDVATAVAALGFDAPVHTLLTGRPDEFDRRVEITKAPKYGIVGSTRELEVKVTESGRRPTSLGEQVTLRVRREGRPDETRRVQIGRTATFAMPFPHAGVNIVEVELEAAPGELTTANNRVIASAEGVRENLRVLLVSGEPHAGERTWRNLLKSDAAVDLVHFTILRPPAKQDGTPINQLSLIQFPVRELFLEKVKDFDLIIFDRYQNRDNILNQLYYDSIARYVESGGALLIAAGDDLAGPGSLARTNLARVMPGVPTGRVLEKPFKAKLSSDGLRHPVTRGLPGSEAQTPTWGNWFRQADITLAGGRNILNGADERPLLVLDRKGQGRVALLTSDHAWLWARGYDGGGPHSDLLRRTAHWLMKEPDLEEERLLATARGLKLTVERRTMGDRVDPVALSAPGGENAQLTLEPAGPGVFRTTIDVKAAGLYKLETNSPSGRLTAVAHAGIEDAREMSEVVATPERMKPIADATGAGVFWTRGNTLLGSGTGVDVPRVSLLQGARVLAGSGWLGLRDREAHVTRGVTVTPMFTGLAALAALLAFISLAWWREGR